MNEFDRKRTSLKMMESILHIHNFYFGRGIRWAPGIAKSVERRRICNKTKALITHDRVVTCDNRGL